MATLQRDSTVGVFVLVGLFAGCWLLSSFGELPSFLGGGEYELEVAMKELNGIGQGSAIFLSGVQIGRVKEVRFKDPAHLDAGVLIIGTIGNEYEIPRTAWAVVQPAGLGFGRGQIEIKVLEGQAEPLPEGEAITGIMGNVWGDMIPDTLLDSVDRSVAQFGNFVESLTPVANDLHQLLDRHTVENVDDPVDEARRVTANLSTVIERFDRTLKTFNDTFGDPEVKAGWLDLFSNVRQMSVDGREALENIHSITTDLRADLARISGKLESGIDDANASVQEISEFLRPALENAAQLTASLLRLTQAVERGEGSAGMFMRDPRLYESLHLSAMRLTEMLDTIQRIAAKFERDGAITLQAKTPIGNVKEKVTIPD